MNIGVSITETDQRLVSVVDAICHQAKNWVLLITSS